MYKLGINLKKIKNVRNYDALVAGWWRTETHINMKQNEKEIDYPVNIVVISVADRTLVVQYTTIMPYLDRQYEILTRHRKSTRCRQ